MKLQCAHSDTGLCESCFKYESEISALKAKLQPMEKAIRLLKQIKVHGFARTFYNCDFLPPCGNGINKWEHNDETNPLKCMFSWNIIGREWGGLCPDHEKLFDEALTPPSQEKEKE